MPFVTLLFLRRTLEIVAKFRIAKCLAKSRIVVFINTNEYQNREISISALFFFLLENANKERNGFTNIEQTHFDILDTR